MKGIRGYVDSKRTRPLLVESAVERLVRGVARNGSLVLKGPLQGDVYVPKGIGTGEAFKGLKLFDKPLFNELSLAAPILYDQGLTDLLSIMLTFMAGNMWSGALSGILFFGAGAVKTDGPPYVSNTSKLRMFKGAANSMPEGSPEWRDAHRRFAETALGSARYESYITLSPDLSQYVNAAEAFIKAGMREEAKEAYLEHASSLAIVLPRKTAQISSVTRSYGRAAFSVLEASVLGMQSLHKAKELGADEATIKGLMEELALSAIGLMDHSGLLKRTEHISERRLGVFAQLVEESKGYVTGPTMDKLVAIKKNVEAVLLRKLIEQFQSVIGFAKIRALLRKIVVKETDRLPVSDLVGELVRSCENALSELRQFVASFERMGSEEYAKKGKTKAGELERLLAEQRKKLSSLPDLAKKSDVKKERGRSPHQAPSGLKQALDLYVSGKAELGSIAFRRYVGSLPPSAYKDIGEAYLALADILKGFERASNLERSAEYFGKAGNAPESKRLLELAADEYIAIGKAQRDSSRLRKASRIHEGLGKKKEAAYLKELAKRVEEEAKDYEVLLKKVRVHLQNITLADLELALATGKLEGLRRKLKKEFVKDFDRLIELRNKIRSPIP